MSLDRCIAAVLTPLAIWVLLNGLDDLFIAITAGIAWLRFRFARDPQIRHPTQEELLSVPERHMAIFVCLYREHRVIRNMIEHNARHLRYRNYDFFIGVYPNDLPTVAAAKDVCQRYPNVHLSTTPHPGGTSKADNLNWIFQRMLIHEEEHHVHFDMIVLHDAEDIIDPDDLLWINYYAQWFDQVQVPVLALPTPLRDFTHGVYCDEFAEFQYKDMPARELLGGFLPSSGVGTGFSRRCLESVASRHSNQIFDATSLTEDYETGYRIHQSGFRQKFIRVSMRGSQPVATREYFAQNFKKAVGQRTRWVTGITLQSWEKHGVRETFSQCYWFWRDRKGLAGNLITPVTNILCIYGFTTWSIARLHHARWGLGAEPMAQWFWAIAMFPLMLLVFQGGVRTFCTSRIYGWKFAAFVPLRIPWANLINFCATSQAIWHYAGCRLRGVPLRWIKTEHAYPNRAALVVDRRKVGEILVDLEYVSKADLEAALMAQPQGMRIGEYLVHLGKLDEQGLYEALSMQQNLPLGKPNPGNISSSVTRTIPAHLARKWKVLPFRVVAGELYVASSELPCEEIALEVKEYCPLDIRFHLVNPSEFQELADQYLPPVTP